MSFPQSEASPLQGKSKTRVNHTMRKHWLLFTQAVTVALALLFIVQTLKPELLPSVARGGAVTLQESAPHETEGKIPAMGLSAAAQKAMPSVVNIFTSTIIKTP